MTTDVEERLRRLELGDEIPSLRAPLLPVEPPQWALPVIEREQAELRRQREEFEAINARIRAAREEIEAERLRNWEAHRPERERAEAQLLGVRRQMEHVEAELRRLQAREADLEEIAGRFAR